jgi:hypothetical protein
LDADATIYPPNINPINGKVLSPNMHKVYGKASIVKLENDHAVLNITENNYGPNLLQELGKYVVVLKFNNIRNNYLNLFLECSEYFTISDN